MFRAFLASDEPAERLVERLVEFGCLVEQKGNRLLAIDCADEDSASVVSGYLAKLEEAGRLEFEAGRT